MVEVCRRGECEVRECASEGKGLKSDQIIFNKGDVMCSLKVTRSNQPIK